MPPEAYTARRTARWFGGLAPLDVQTKARGRGMFDAWDDYLAALSACPITAPDLPRAMQSNTLMAATLGRLGEALCARAAEHDLHGKIRRRSPQRVVVRVRGHRRRPDPTPSSPTRIDVLHRTFVGYPLSLAPAERTAKLSALYRAVVAHHAEYVKTRDP